MRYDRQAAQIEEESAPTWNRPCLCVYACEASWPDDLAIVLKTEISSGSGGGSRGCSNVFCEGLVLVVDDKDGSPLNSVCLHLVSIYCTQIGLDGNFLIAPDADPSSDCSSMLGAVSFSWHQSRCFG